MSSRTPNTLVDEVVAALQAAGLTVEQGDETTPGVWELEIDGATTLVQPYRHPGARPATPGGPVAMVEVADRVPEWRRTELREQRTGWLDRRGHVRLWAPRLKIELPFAPGGGAGRRRQGDVRLEVALWALCHPTERLTVRPVARALDRSAAQVSAVIGAWTEDGLIDRDRHADLPALFWAMVDAWPANGWIRAADADLTVAQVGDASVDVSDAVASRWGALIGIGTPTSDGAPGSAPTPAGHRYITDPAAWKRLVRVTEGRDDAASVGVRHWCRPSPTRWLPRLGDEVHPVVVAARLAAGDRRGREIVEVWDIGDRLSGWALP